MNREQILTSITLFFTDFLSSVSFFFFPSPRKNDGDKLELYAT